MSRKRKFFAGIGFRTNTPSFDAGEEISAFITGYDGDVPVARIGDSILRIEGAPDGAVDIRAILKVESFDDSNHTGTATFVEKTGESAY
ncbi:DUF7513 family protein [Halorussus halophilus]|uniref:DUF7513 family protein n=1 Tax=Halorussus halophilus TaxID=2650975 RepID=UPI001301330D|nr:hypothetical protein [Halorussus halophilus]